MTTETLQTLAPILSGPAAVVVVGYWVKSQLKKVDQISGLLVQMQHIRDTQIEIKADMKRLNENWENFLVLRSEVKSQWKQIDDIREKVKHGF